MKPLVIEIDLQKYSERFGKDALRRFHELCRFSKYENFPESLLYVLNLNDKLKLPLCRTHQYLHDGHLLLEWWNHNNTAIVLSVEPPKFKLYIEGYNDDNEIEFTLDNIPPDLERQMTLALL